MIVLPIAIGLTITALYSMYRCKRASSWDSAPWFDMLAVASIGAIIMWFAFTATVVAESIEESYVSRIEDRYDIKIIDTTAEAVKFRKDGETCFAIKRPNDGLLFAECE